MEFSIMKVETDEILFNTHVLKGFSLEQLVVLRNELNERIKMYHCFCCGERFNWYCGKYGVEIPSFQKPPQCTIKINPQILEEKLKRNNINNYKRD